MQDLTLIHSEQKFPLPLLMRKVRASAQELEGPDHQVWQYNGIDDTYFTIYRHESFFHYCGYLTAPKEICDIFRSASVHGGWTFDAEGVAAATKILQGVVTLDPAKEWVTLGFDCGHYADKNALNEHGDYRTHEYVLNDLLGVVKSPRSFSDIRSLLNGSEQDKTLAFLVGIAGMHDASEECFEYIKTWINRLPVDAVKTHLNDYYQREEIPVSWSWEAPERKHWGPLSTQLHIETFRQHILENVEEDAIRSAALMILDHTILTSGLEGLPDASKEWRALGLRIYPDARRLREAEALAVLEHKFGYKGGM